MKQEYKKCPKCGFNDTRAGIYYLVVHKNGYTRLLKTACSANKALKYGYDVFKVKLNKKMKVNKVLI